MISISDLPDAGDQVVSEVLLAPPEIAPLAAGRIDPTLPQASDPAIASDPGSPTISSSGRSARRARRQIALVRDVAGPVVRWAGGKTRLLGQILPLLPKSYGRYREPFAGGAAVFFELRPNHAAISDTCADLIELYQEIARDAVRVYGALCRRTSVERPLDAYYATRAAWNQDRASWSSVDRAATFLYLNRSCFNGLFRVRKSDGYFNVPVGSFGKDGAGVPSYPTIADLISAGEALRRAEISCADYRESLNRAEAGDLVYVDPPYLALSETANFSGYTQAGFGSVDHEDLARRVLDLVSRGVQVVVSQPDLPVVRDLYAGLSVHSASVSRSIGAARATRKKVGELILTGGYDP